MAMENTRKYPVGIQTFERIRKEGYIYIDKTDLVWQAARESPFVFLSRPRRFGKSLLSTTFDAYFKGQKELFEGLKIMDLETEWNSFPVIHLDLSSAKNQRTPDELKDMLMFIMEPHSQEYGMEKSENSPGKLLAGMIRRAYIQTGGRYH